MYVGETSIVGRGKSHQQDCGVKKNILAVEGAFSEAICEDASFFVRMTIYKKYIMLHKCLILASGKSPNRQNLAQSFHVSSRQSKNKTFQYSPRSAPPWIS